jgi:hypothetical protein
MTTFLSGLAIGAALIALGALVIFCAVRLTDPDDYPPRKNPDPSPHIDLSQPVSEFDTWAEQEAAVVHSRIEAGRAELVADDLLAAAVACEVVREPLSLVADVLEFPTQRGPGSDS